MAKRYKIMALKMAERKISRYAAVRLTAQALKAKRTTYHGARQIMADFDELTGFNRQ